MIRVTNITVIPHFQLNCRFNNGVEKKLNVLPIIQHHKHLAGVESLLNEEIFANVRIGEFGEIFWENIVKSEYDGQVFFWNYDISPEYAYQNSTL